MNSVVGPIFNENFIEKRGLWVPWTVHGTHWKSYKKKKKEADIDVWTWNAIQMELEYNTSLHDSYYYNNIFDYYKKIMTEIQVL